jgi:hypothetical protein
VNLWTVGCADPRLTAPARSPMDSAIAPAAPGDPVDRPGDGQSHRHFAGFAPTMGHRYPSRQVLTPSRPEFPRFRWYKQRYRD